MKPEELSYFLINRYGESLTKSVGLFAEEIGLSKRQVWRMLSGEQGITRQTSILIALLDSQSSSKSPTPSRPTES